MPGKLLDQRDSAPASSSAVPLPGTTTSVLEEAAAEQRAWLIAAGRTACSHHCDA